MLQITDRRLQDLAGLGDDGKGFHRSGVAAFDERLRGLAGLQVDRGQGLHQRRERLHRSANDDLLAVRDAALDPTCAIRLAIEAALVPQDLVVRLGPALRCKCEPFADLHSFDRLGPHQRRGEACVETLVLRRIGTKSGWYAARAYFDHTADGVPIRTGVVHLLLD